MNNKIEKKGQEEMVGFAMIIVILAVIILVFVGISLNKPAQNELESYEVESFLQVLLQHTTDCGEYEPYSNVQNLITLCEEARQCYDGRASCNVLNQTLSKVLDSSWPVGKDRPIKGYTLNITREGNQIMFIQEGNETYNSKGSLQLFSDRGDQYILEFKAYY